MKKQTEGASKKANTRLHLGNIVAFARGKVKIFLRRSKGFTTCTRSGRSMPGGNVAKEYACYAKLAEGLDYYSGKLLCSEERGEERKRERVGYSCHVTSIIRRRDCHRLGKVGMSDATAAAAAATTQTCVRRRERLFLRAWNLFPTTVT